MKKIIVTLAAMVFGYSLSAQNINTLVGNYISVKNALVNGDSKLAAQAIATFNQNLEIESNFGQKEALVKATGKMKEAGNIDKQRAVFNELSTTMWTLMKSRDTVSQPLYYQYCPMKKAYWLSLEKEIKNPYYGSAMLSCGKVVETKK